MIRSDYDLIDANFQILWLVFIKLKQIHFIKLHMFMILSLYIKLSRAIDCGGHLRRMVWLESWYIIKLKWRCNGVSYTSPGFESHQCQVFFVHVIIVYILSEGSMTIGCWNRRLDDVRYQPIKYCPLER